MTLVPVPPFEETPEIINHFLDSDVHYRVLKEIFRHVCRQDCCDIMKSVRKGCPGYIIYHPTGKKSWVPVALLVQRDGPRIMEIIKRTAFGRRFYDSYKRALVRYARAMSGE